MSTTTELPGESATGGRRPRRHTTWWRRPWVMPLAFVAIAFLVYSLPPYLGLDPSESRVPTPPGLAWYYPALAAHIGFASIAMLSCVLQVWPWFRQRYPVAHRRIGRVYVFAGVLPAGVCGFAIGTVSPFGPVAAVSNVTLATLWLIFTVNGYRAARARQFGEHRKWMIRSFVLTMSIITNRIWGIFWALILAPQLETTFGGSEVAFGQTLAGLTTWTGWVFPLLIAEWWLQRRRRPRAARVSAAAQ